MSGSIFMSPSSASGSAPFQMTFGNLSGSVVSGSIGFGPIPISLSGAIVSGQIYVTHKCHQCHQSFNPNGYVCGLFHAGRFYCFECAGYDPKEQRFHPFREGLLADTPFLSGTPYGIVADWLDEHGRSEAATYLRNYQ